MADSAAMDDPLSLAIPCLFFVAGVPLVVVGAVAFGRRERRRARALAEALGLEFAEPNSLFDAAIDEAATDARHAAVAKGFVGGVLSLLSPWRVTGTRGGRTVGIELVRRGSGKSKSVYTRFVVQNAPGLALGLEVRREGMLAKLGKSLGGSADLTIGDPNFDSRALVRAADEDATRMLLSRSTVKESLLALFDVASAAVVNDHEVAVEIAGRTLDPEKARRYLDPMIEVSRALDGSRYQARA